MKSLFSGLFNNNLNIFDPPVLPKSGLTHLTSFNKLCSKRHAKDKLEGHLVTRKLSLEELLKTKRNVMENLRSVRNIVFCISKFLKLPLFCSYFLTAVPIVSIQKSRRQVSCNRKKS